MLNEGLEVLGTDEYKDNGGYYKGVFHGSAIESVTLPSTLKRIEYDAFCKCTKLKNVQLPEGLEYVGKYCFWESALESITLPSSLKTIEQSAFYQCRNLKSVCLPEGLEKIDLFAFSETGLENV